MEHINLLFLIPMAWMAGWIRVLSQRLDKMKEDTYSKQETKEMIRLHQEPLLVKMENIDNTTKEMKHMLEKVLDDKK